MVNWMIEVVKNFKQPFEVLILAVQTMDRYFSEETQRVLALDEDLHRVGVTCLWIASKYEASNIIPVGTVAGKIAHGKVSQSQLRESELVILKSLRYKISSQPSVWDLI